MNTPIKREDIRKGDRVRKTIAQVVEFTAAIDYMDPAHESETYELIERPVQLPTVPGIYEDAEGNLWRLHFGSEDARQEWTLDDDPMSDSTARAYAPFTLLRPVAEVAAEVLAEAREAVHVYAGVNAEPLTLCAFDDIAAKFGAAS